MIDFDAHICGKCGQDFKGKSEEAEMYRDSTGVHFACPQCARGMQNLPRDSIGIIIHG